MVVRLSLKMVGFLRLCQHFAKRKLATNKDNESETSPAKKAKVEVKEDLDEEKKILNLGLKVERLPIKKDVETSEAGIWHLKPGFEFGLKEDKKDDFEAKPQLSADKLGLTKVLAKVNGEPVVIGHQNHGNNDEKEEVDGDDDVQVVSQFIELEKLVADTKFTTQEERDPWLDELNEAIVDCDNDDSTSNYVDVCFYKPLDVPLDICDKPISSSSGTIARQFIPSCPSHQNTMDEIVDVETLVPIPDIGQTQDPNVFLQSYFNPLCQNFFPFHKDLDQNESEAEMNDNGTAANANESSSVALPSSSGARDMEKEIPLIWIDDESDSVKPTKCGTVPTKPVAKGSPPSIQSVTIPWQETSLIRNYEILLSQHFSSRLNVDVRHCSGDTSTIQLTNFITPKTTFHPVVETASHDFLYPVSSLNGQFPTLENQVQEEELFKHKRKAKKGKKKRKCKRRHCKKCKRRKSKSKQARESSEFINAIQDSAAPLPICERTSGIGSGTPSETSSTSGVADLMSDASSSTVSEDHRVRLPSPEIIGSTGPDLDMVESETSDYQRSTPSPREHPPFLEESVNRLKRENTDLGFGDEIKEDAHPATSVRNNFTISAKSFYNSTKPEVVLKSMQKIKSNKCLTVDLYQLPMISNSTKKKKKKKKKFKYLGDDGVANIASKRAPSSSVLDTLKNNRVKVSKHFKLTQDPKIMYQQAQVKIKRLPVSANTIMSVSEDLLSRVSVSPKKCRNISDMRANDWFSELSKPPRHAHNHTIKPTLPSTNVFPSPERSLIRPAVLNVIATTPTKTDPEDDSMSGNRFSSPPQKSLSSSLRDTSNLVNPFLPLQKSSYLFGGTDDFEQNEEVIEYDEEETDDFSDHDVESNAPVTKVADCNIPTDTLPSPKDLKVTKSNSTLDLDHLFGLGDKSTAQVNQGEKSSISTNAGTTATKIRFPAVQGPKNMIECKWNSCQKKFTTYGKLSDHLKACHVISQVFEQTGLDSEVYQCLWEGCKVYAKKSCSKSWLEKHVPTHGGKFAFACIVSGCKMRFSSQKILQRHVNHHFAQNDNEVSGTTPGSQCRAQNKKSRKYTDHNQSESTKNLKRAGVKLKFRHTVFSARIFDFFDPGIMTGIKHQVYNLERIGSHKYNISGDSITFRSRVLGVKKHERATTIHHHQNHRDGDNQDDDMRMALVRWTPENLLDDEWLPMSQVQAWKTVKICHLPEKAKVKLGQDLFGLGRAPSRTSIQAPESESVDDKSSLISLQNGAPMASRAATTTSVSAGAPKGASKRKQYARPKSYL